MCHIEFLVHFQLIVPLSFHPPHNFMHLFKSIFETINHTETKQR